MIASARINLALGLEEFLDITPRFYSALMRHYDRRVDRESGIVELMGAQIVAMIANTGFRSFEEPRRPNEFMPSQWGKKRRHKGPTKVEQLQNVENYRTYFAAIRAAQKPNDGPTLVMPLQRES